MNEPTNDTSIDISELQDIFKVHPPLYKFIRVRSYGKYEGKAFFLSSDYNWTLTRDSADMLILIPTLK